MANERTGICVWSNDRCQQFEWHHSTACHHGKSQHCLSGSQTKRGWQRGRVFAGDRTGNTSQSEHCVQFPSALQAKEFVIYYQPKVNVSDRTMYGAEALVRWIRNGKMVPPMQFIPQLEREGSVCKLDYYVLESVCAFLKDRQNKGLSVVPISVNYSRRHLEEENLVERTLEIIDRYGVDHHLIEIELTESEDFQNYEIMSGIIDEFKANGIGTSIDDFGTGFSSLNMIKEVDLETIKIDKSFIPLETDYPGKDRDLVMFHSIVQLINELDKKSIAEGLRRWSSLNI